MTVNGWDTLVDAKVVFSRARFFHPTVTSVTKEFLQAMKFAVAGTPCHPHTWLVDPGTLVCACRRSVEFNKGCRLCWAVSIGNRRCELLKAWNAVSSESHTGQVLASLLDVQGDNFLASLESATTFADIYRIGLRFLQFLNTIEAMCASEHRVQHLCGSCDIFASLCDSDGLCAGRSLLSAELSDIDRRISALACGPCSPLTHPRFDPLFQMKFAEIESYREWLSANRPDVMSSLTMEVSQERVQVPNVSIADERMFESIRDSPQCGDRFKTPTFVKSTAGDIRDGIASWRLSLQLISGHVDGSAAVVPREDSAVTGDVLPSELTLFEGLKRLGLSAKMLGMLTISRDLLPELVKLHQVVLLHSSEIARGVCEELEATLSFRSEEPLVSRLSVFFEHTPLSLIEANELRPSSNVARMLESLSLTFSPSNTNLSPLLTTETVNAYWEMFKVVCALEYATFAQSRSWKMLSIWADREIYSIWKGIDAYLSSIYWFIRTRGVDQNQILLQREFNTANCLIDQIHAHSEFMKNVSRDFFLTSSGKPYLAKILDLCSTASSFRVIVQRCNAFQLEAASVKTELAAVIDNYLATTEYLRKNLKAEVWNFI